MNRQKQFQELFHFREDIRKKNMCLRSQWLSWHQCQPSCKLFCFREDIHELFRFNEDIHENHVSV